MGAAHPSWSCRLVICRAGAKGEEEKETEEETEEKEKKKEEAETDDAEKGRKMDEAREMTRRKSFE